MISVNSNNVKGYSAQPKQTVYIHHSHMCTIITLAKQLRVSARIHIKNRPNTSITKKLWQNCANNTSVNHQFDDNANNDTCKI